MDARLLLIEDDASIARFVQLALEELPCHDPAAPPVTLVVTRDLAGARAALAQGGWRLVISDLMLPDGSAESLLEDGLALAPGAPPWVVFSAGVHEDRHAALRERGVARTLRKPVPLAELLDVVAELLRPAGRAAPAPAAPAPALPPVSSVSSVSSVPRDAAPDPVQQHFGGDHALFKTFRTGCIERFATDIAQGDAALASGDAAALQRVVHSLKSVLALIGEPALAARARALEDAAAAWQPGAPLPPGWPALARELGYLRP